MKYLQILFTLMVAVLFTTQSCTQFSGLQLKDSSDTASYAYGVYLGKGLVAQNLRELDPEIVKRGIEDVLGEKSDTMEVEDAQWIMRNYFMNKQKEENLEKYGDNIKAGEEFLRKNREIEGVVTTGSGLQYKVLVQGTGPVPDENDLVHVHYTGTLIDGTRFDGNREGEPSVFGVSQVISGWTEVLLLMPEGSKWMVYIPHDLAYGDQERAGGVIQPYSTLVFEIELLKIEPRE